ncbi:hypothetical protein U1Q18_029320 [Sarracenia purpurea var. burkii]
MDNRTHLTTEISDGADNVRIASRAAECEEAFALVSEATTELSKKIEDICTKNLRICHVGEAPTHYLPTTGKVDEDVQLVDQVAQTAKGLKKRHGRNEAPTHYLPPSREVNIIL